MDQSNVQLKDALKKIRNLINKSVLDSEIKDSILVPIPIIEDKVDSHQIHVGLIGESSQDKVAVLNSLLNTDFFQLPKGGQTRHRLVRTLIEHSPEETLSVTMFNGKVYNTKSNMLRLTKRFLPERYQSFSFIDKIKYFFGIHKDTAANADIMRELYHEMVVSAEAQELVSSMRLGLPLETLPDYLVIVDTPSLGINNDTTQRVIKETMKILCDEVILLTPADDPLSDKVKSFLKDNLGDNQDICRIFLTGLEKVKDQGERDRILKELGLKAEYELRISSRNVMGAPAALELHHRGVASHLPTQTLNSIPQDEKTLLLDQYKRDRERCFTAYNIRKETAVVEKKFSIVEEYIRFIVKLIEDSTQKNDQEAQMLAQLMVQPLQDFLRAFYNNVDIRSKTQNIGQNLIAECKGYMQDFVDSVFNDVDQAAMGKNPKDAVQGVMKEKKVKDLGDQTCAKCYQSYVFKFDYLKNVYQDVFVQLESDLQKTYGISDANLVIGNRLQYMGIINYNMNISTEGLTTFRLKRLFTSVSTIQAQMKKAIQDASFKYYGQIAGTYSSNLDQVNKELNAQADKIRTGVLDCYKKQIDQRIAELNARQKNLKDNNASLAALKDIVNKVIGYEVQ